MEIKNLIKKTLHGTYACFTVMTAVYILIVIFLNTDSKEILVEGSRVLLFLALGARLLHATLRKKRNDTASLQMKFQRYNKRKNGRVMP